MNPRIRRLEADYQRVLAAFRNHPRIHVAAMEGTPPEKYTFELHVRGLQQNADGRLEHVDRHRCEVFLPVDYPRRAPFCRMVTPVFHPNIDPQKICIGDHWSAAQSLDQLIVRIAEIVCYQSYNVKSPLNAQAAAWAQQNAVSLPLDPCDLTALS